MVNRSWCYTVASLSISRCLAGTRAGIETGFLPGSPDTRRVLFPFLAPSPRFSLSLLFPFVSVSILGKFSLVNRQYLIQFAKGSIS